MARYDNQPGFAIDVDAEKAYQLDIEALIGPLSNYGKVIELGEFVYEIQSFRISEVRLFRSVMSRF